MKKNYGRERKSFFILINRDRNKHPCVIIRHVISCPQQEDMYSSDEKLRMTAYKLSQGGCLDVFPLEKSIEHC